MKYKITTVGGGGATLYVEFYLFKMQNKVEMEFLLLIWNGTFSM